MRIQFIDECHINAIKYEKNSVHDESTIPADWLVGALRHGFVKRLGDEKVSVVETKGGTVPADVEAKLKEVLS